MDEYIAGTHFSPIYGLRVGGTEYEVQYIINLIKKYNIKRFVEIGVHVGGLTEYLLNSRYVMVKYLGIEINENIVDQRIKDWIKSSGNAIHYMDCMTDECVHLVEEFAWQDEEHSLIYCDNGHKALEIHQYIESPFIGDILLTHDFSDGTRQIDGIENYVAREVTPEDIQFIENQSHHFERLPDDKRTRFVGWLRK